MLKSVHMPSISRATLVPPSVNPLAVDGQREGFPMVHHHCLPYEVSSVGVGVGVRDPYAPEGTKISHNTGYFCTDS